MINKKVVRLKIIKNVSIRKSPVKKKTSIVIVFLSCEKLMTVTFFILSDSKMIAK